VKEMLPKLFMDKMDKRGQNISFNIVHNHFVEYQKFHLSLISP